MRALILLVATAACSRTYNPKANLGVDGDWRGARELELRCKDDGSCSATRRDVVTWRGGDRTDWHVVHLPMSRCFSAELDIGFQWEAARPPMRFAIDVMLIDGSQRPMPIRRMRGLEKARAHIDRLPGGPIYLRVSVPTKDGAGTYRLRVVAPDDPCLASDIYQPRPDEIAASPSGTSSVLAAGMTRQADPDIWWSLPSIVLDANDPAIRIGSRGVLLDPSGRPVRDAEIEVMTVWSPDGPASSDAPRFASARLIHARAFKRRLRAGWDLWSVAIAPQR